MSTPFRTEGSLSSAGWPICFSPVGETCACAPARHEKSSAHAAANRRPLPEQPRSKPQSGPQSAECVPARALVLRQWCLLPHAAAKFSCTTCASALTAPARLALLPCAAPVAAATAPLPAPARTRCARNHWSAALSLPGCASPVISGSVGPPDDYRQSVLRDDLHRPVDGNSHLALLLIHPGVVIQQQIFAGVQVGDILVAVVGLQLRRREALPSSREAAAAPAPRSIPDSCPCLSASLELVPLVRRPVVLHQRALITLPMPKQKTKKTPTNTNSEIRKTTMPPTLTSDFS